MELNTPFGRKRAPNTTYTQNEVGPTIADVVAAALAALPTLTELAPALNHDSDLELLLFASCFR